MNEIPRGKAKFIMGITSPAQLEEWLIEHQGCRGMAMVGRSNVGKSSLINTLFGKKTAVTSKTPGRTRAINIFEIQQEEFSGEENFYLFDLPGYGHAEVSKEMAKNWEKLISTFFAILPSKVRLYNIQDSRHPNQKADQGFLKFIKNYDAYSVLVFNKIDKLKTQKQRSELNKTKKDIFKNYKMMKEIYFVSAESKEGMESLNQSILSYMKGILTAEELN